MRRAFRLCLRSPWEGPHKMNKVIIEEVIVESLKQGLIDKSKEIIDKKIEEFNLQLCDKARVGINDIILSIDMSSFDNAREITREINIGIHIEFKERIEV